MKKLLIVLTLVLSIGIANAQSYDNSPSNTALYLRGGYSWFTGVVGAEIQTGYFGIGGGWMPNKTPLTGKSISTYSACATFYGAPHYQPSYYVSMGYIGNGYVYENSNGTVITEDVFGLMAGYKWGSEIIDIKGGIGYGWYSGGGTWTWEVTLGLNLLGF